MIESPRTQPSVRLLQYHPVAAAWLLLALGSAVLRLIVIDRLPLSEVEARYAVPAWQAVLGQLDGSLVDGGAPFLSHALVVVFGLFGASDVAARLVPALAGIGLVLTPALLTGTLGLRTALWAGFLLAVSPITVQASRVLDPAVVTGGLVMLVVCSSIRLATDRPWWSPWTLALGAGLCLTAAGSAVLAVGAAGVVALVLGARQVDDTGAPGGWGRLPRLRAYGPEMVRTAARPATLVLGAVLVAGTAGLTDLRGLGFAFADVWVHGLALLAPDAFPTRNSASLLAYGAPLLALALAGYVLALRDARPPPAQARRRVRQPTHEDDGLLELEALRLARRERIRIVAFLASWTLILLVIAAVAGGDELALSLLPVLPSAVLAATALARLPLDPKTYVLSAEGSTAVLLGAILPIAAAVIFSQTLAAARPTPLVAWVALFGVIVLLASAWRRLAASERTAAVAILGGVAFLAVTASGLSRASFGAGPPGTELLMREETDPAFRRLFRDLNVLASADPSRALVVDLPEPYAARWYGRAIPPGAGARPASPRAWVLREASPERSERAEVVRVPWKTTSEIEPSDVYPLGILRWLATRSVLVHGRPHDIIVTR